MKQISFKAIEKKLERKNAELVEVREFRKKLDDKEKEICAAIDKLQNRKLEAIFEQVKKEIKNKNLDITSASVLTIVDALKGNQQILSEEETSAEFVETAEIESIDNDLKIGSEKSLSEEKFSSEMVDEDFEESLSAKVSEEK